MLAVIDTNVLVSALWSSDGKPAKIMALVQNGRITPCYDHRILTEYRGVLERPKFGFASGEIADLLEQIEADGLSVVASPINIPFVDESDRKFYEVAKYCNAKLITGNMRHFPDDGTAQSVAKTLAFFDI
jgi:putative PIN family toxin of toxin-antitoxin system